MKSQELTIDSSADRIEVLKVIEELPEDEKWTVIVKLFSEAKTAAQNRLLWRWNREIGAHYGWTEDDAHEWFKERYLVRIKMETNENFVALVGMINEYDPKSDKYKQAAKALAAEITTKNLKTKPMANYLKRIKFYAIHEGIPITIPKQEELDWLLGVKRNKPKVTNI